MQPISSHLLNQTCLEYLHQSLSNPQPIPSAADPPNPATFGIRQSVLIRGVASFQGVDLYSTVDSL